MEFTLEALAKFWGPWAVTVLLLVFAIKFLNNRLTGSEARCVTLTTEKESLLREVMKLAHDNADAFKEAKQAAVDGERKIDQHHADNTRILQEIAVAVRK